MTDLTSLTLAEARDRLKSRTISSVEIIKAHLEAIERAKGLNAFVAITADKALQMAEAEPSAPRHERGGAARGVADRRQGPLRNRRRSYPGVQPYSGRFKPRYKSTVTAHLWRDGAVMLGKLNMDEFAMGSSNETSYYGPVASPWLPPNWSRDRARAALCPAEARSADHRRLVRWLCFSCGRGPLSRGYGERHRAGSIRQPAAFTGIVDRKPTYGRCSRYGMVASALSAGSGGASCAHCP